jgi:hypothetical protein
VKKYLEDTNIYQSVRYTLRQEGKKYQLEGWDQGTLVHPEVQSVGGGDFFNFQFFIL